MKFQPQRHEEREEKPKETFALFVLFAPLRLKFWSLLVQIRNKESAMTLAEILQDIHACKEDMLKFERKYDILSATFYAAYSTGEEPPDPISMLDWIGWAGVYQIWMSRQEEYQAAITALQQQMPLLEIIEKSWRREPLVIPA